MLLFVGVILGSNNVNRINLYSTRNIIRVIKWKKTGWADHVARTREKIN